MIIFLFCCCYK